MENQMTRRDFVGASALAGAGLAALGVGSPVVARADESFDKEVDFAVVGTGTAVFAAFAAKDAGASSVALIEKAPTFGGTAAYSGGAFWVPCNSLMAEAGLEDNREDALTYVQANSEGQSTDALLVAYIDNAAPFAEWVTEYVGINWGFLSGWPLYGEHSWMDYTDLPGFREYGRTLTIAGSNVGVNADADLYGGPFMWKLIREMVEADDVIDLMYETAAKHLIVDESGAVIGVECEGPEGTLRIKSANGVLLGCGGFDHDQVWRSRFLRTPVFNTVSMPACTGDAHKMDLEVGAAQGNMQNYWGTPSTIPPADVPENLFDGSVFYNDMFRVFDSPLRRAKPNAIVVNKSGMRIGDESASYHQFNRCFEGYDAGAAVPRNFPAYFVGDATFVANYLLPGTANEDSVGDIPEGTVIADTLEELAEALGIDKAGLLKTVEEFNEGARRCRPRLPSWRVHLRPLRPERTSRAVPTSPTPALVRSRRPRSTATHICRACWAPPAAL